MIIYQKQNLRSYTPGNLPRVGDKIQKISFSQCGAIVAEIVSMSNIFYKIKILYNTLDPMCGGSMGETYSVDTQHLRYNYKLIIFNNYNTLWDTLINEI